MTWDSGTRVWELKTEPGARSWEPGGPEPDPKSRELGSGSWGTEARTEESGAGIRELGDRSPNRRAGSWEQGAGGPEHEPKSRELGAVSWGTGA